MRKINSKGKIIRVTYIFYLLISLAFPICMIAQNEPKQVRIISGEPTDNEILNALNGGGVKFSNPNLLAGDRKKQIAIFYEGLQANFMMDKGILFSTGNAMEDLMSRNKEVNKGVIVNLYKYSDPDLVKIFPNALYDVVVFTFDVTLDSYTTALRVGFQFGSEEYPDFVGSEFNDVFGFFVEGEGIDGTFNMARLPTNQNVISINSVNYGRRGYEAKDIQRPLDLKQSSQYINNGHTTNYIKETDRLLKNRNENFKPVFIEYNGLTKLITYDLINLYPETTYKFKIAIADSGDGLFDSGVLIQKIQGTTGADLALTKTVNKSEAATGEEVVFTLTASNIGPYRAEEVIVKDLLPNGYEFVSAEASKGTYDPLTGIWAISTLEVLTENVTLEIVANVTDTGNYINKAEISSNAEDPDTTNNFASAKIFLKSPKMSLTKTGIFQDENGNGFADISETIRYDFELSNVGNSDLRDVLITDPLFEDRSPKHINGDINNDGILNVGEVWKYYEIYPITEANIARRGVYNLATVSATDEENKISENTSFDPNPLDLNTEGHPGFDPNCPNCTIVILNGKKRLISNPHVHQKVK